MSFASHCIFFLAASAIAASTQALAAPAPEFGPNPAVGWVVISNGFLPPDSGAGPIRQDPAHPYVGNDEFRRTGRQPTMPFADLSNTILQPWTRNELQKRSELVLAGKAPTLGIDCGPTAVPPSSSERMFSPTSLFRRRTRFSLSIRTIINFATSILRPSIHGT